MRLTTVIFLCGVAGGSLTGCSEDATARTPVAVEQSPTAAAAAPPAAVPVADTVGMVYVDGEAGGYYIDATEVTTAAFAAFIAATGYVTEADSFGWSGVFSKEQQAWLPVDGANWEYPLGPDGPPARPDEPVTQVSYRDAATYARWAGKRLPTEAEWLYAATQSGQHTDYPWGQEMLPQGEYRGNWWQGPFPYADQVADGYPGVAAVAQFPAAANGTFDMAGNVWEWTASERPGTGEAVIKGGSFLCSTSYCTGFNLQQRQFTPKDSGLNHLGFRCVAG